MNRRRCRSSASFRWRQKSRMYGVGMHVRKGVIRICEVGPLLNLIDIHRFERDLRIKCEHFDELPRLAFLKHNSSAPVHVAGAGLRCCPPQTELHAAPRRTAPLPRTSDAMPSASSWRIPLLLVRPFARPRRARDLLVTGLAPVRACPCWCTKKDRGSQAAAIPIHQMMERNDEATRT